MVLLHLHGSRRLLHLYLRRLHQQSLTAHISHTNSVSVLPRDLLFENILLPATYRSVCIQAQWIYYRCLNCYHASYFSSPWVMLVRQTHSHRLLQSLWYRQPFYTFPKVAQVINPVQYFTLDFQLSDWPNASHFFVRPDLLGYLLPKVSFKGLALVHVFTWYMHQTFALCLRKMSSSNMLTTQPYLLPNRA